MHSAPFYSLHLTVDNRATRLRFPVPPLSIHLTTFFGKFSLHQGQTFNKTRDHRLHRRHHHQRWHKTLTSFIPPPFHPYQKSPLNHSIHTAHPLSPSNIASSVKHDLPFIAARAREREREGTATGGGRDRGKKKKEIQKAQAAFHFRCLAMQLCPASTVLANSASSP